MSDHPIRYLVDIDGRRCEVCIGSQTEELTVDGEPMDVDLVAIGESDFSVLVERRSVHMAIEAGGEAGAFLVDDGRRTHEVRVQDEREARRAASRSERGQTGGGLIQASMPGIVTQILVANGDTVEEDQPLLILEAMKMENEIRAESPGRVESVQVVIGQSVSKGDRLVSIEALADDEAS